MLNELNKNHMGGIDNFGSEDLYNLDDAWEDNGHDVKPKVWEFAISVHLLQFDLIMLFSKTALLQLHAW